MNRRRVLRGIGAGTMVVAGTAGIASAGQSKLRYNFYGCSQVCVNKRGVKAVVWTGRETKKVRITASSNRNDPAVREWKSVYCYEVDDPKKIIGLYYDGRYIENENRCAMNVKAK
ncbi:hypothetical protein [Halomarina rubra]|uniref:Tat pathway signal protein n=1 Tax=Halomarina rubra TaxID=2071873 RepID=A0ABD6AQY3_9EURY|nr:hypothetical protein [Halomarina rubra]